MTVYFKYQDSMSLEEKMKFYLDYYDIDKSAWDAFMEIWTFNR